MPCRRDTTHPLAAAEPFPWRRGLSVCSTSCKCPSRVGQPVRHRHRPRTRCGTRRTPLARAADGSSPLRGTPANPRMRRNSISLSRSGILPDPVRNRSVTQVTDVTRFWETILICALRILFSRKRVTSVTSVTRPWENDGFRGVSTVTRVTDKSALQIIRWTESALRRRSTCHWALARTLDFGQLRDLRERSSDLPPGLRPRRTHAPLDAVNRRRIDGGLLRQHVHRHSASESRGS